ncbi:cationic trypsin-3-like [Osmerus eperlanus]|uniref:cationic trypsin-3-like n=1 Tax=Osmerus eperlanus TaxID=29151 RepID=UPI002E164D89
MKMALAPLLLLLLWTESTLSYNQKRILGGYDCAATERLYHVHLYKHHNTFTSEYVCGGSLIHAQWVLTAAKCYFPKDKKGWEVHVHVGVHGGQQVTEIPISEIQWFHDDENIRDGEIILLKLQSAVPDGITPVSLPECDDKGQPTVALKSIQLAGHILSTKRLVGWQKDVESKNLLCVDMNVVPCPEPSMFCPFKIGSLKNNLCYKGKGKDAGKGDSGGGVVDKASNTIYGVHLEDDSTACGTPPRSFNVCTQIKQIKKNIGLEKKK